MSIFVRLGRIFFLVAVCCSGAFADTYPSQLFSAVELHKDKVPDAHLILKNKSAKLALPWLGSLTPSLTNQAEVALLSPALFGGRTPDIQFTPKNKAENRALPQLASFAPQPTGHGHAALPPAEPFVLPAKTAPPGEIPAKWTELQPRILADERTLAACDSVNSPCPQAARRFLSIVELGRKRHGRARLGWINRAVNLGIRPMSDWAQYGYADFWASPLQTLSSEAGDCEDYAIVKYVALRHLGIASDDLRLLVVRDNMRRAEHAIVAVRYEQEWLILDNQTMTMLNAERSRHYYPLFVMDYQGVRSFTTVAARR